MWGARDSHRSVMCRSECYVMEDLVSHAEELALSLEDCGKSLEGVGR